MSPPTTPWSELSGASTTWLEGFVVPGGAGEAFVLFGLLIPQADTVQFIDATTIYTELSIGAMASTELVGVLTPYTELTL